MGMGHMNVLVPMCGAILLKRSGLEAPHDPYFMADHHGLIGALVDAGDLDVDVHGIINFVGKSVGMDGEREREQVPVFRPVVRGMGDAAGENEHVGIFAL